MVGILWSEMVAMEIVLPKMRISIVWDSGGSEERDHQSEMIVVESTEGMGDSEDSKMDFKWREKILMKMMTKSLNKMTLRMLQEMVLWEMMWRFSEYILHIDALDDIVNKMF